MKKSIMDLGDIKGKRALVRVDVNVPLDENKNVTDDTRIQAIVPTVKFLTSIIVKYCCFLLSNGVILIYDTANVKQNKILSKFFRDFFSNA